MDKEQINEFMRLAGNQIIENLGEEMKDYVRNVVMVNLEEGRVSLLGKMTLKEAFVGLLENIDTAYLEFMKIQEKGGNNETKK